MEISKQEQNKGVMFALAAYGMYGVMPIYFKVVSSVSAFEVLSHRIIWSVLFLAIFIAATGRWNEFKNDLRQKRLLAGLTISAMLIALNWLVFIWAVGQSMILEVSLGYYITPLLSVLLGMIFLGERLRKIQWISVLLAVAGVGYQLIQMGNLPWVALVLASCFAFYGLLRKQIKVGPFTGLLIETLILTPFALFYLIWLGQQSQLAFLTDGVEIAVLLAAAGIVTSLPLICFAAGARRLTMTLNGLLLYIGPSISFLIAVFMYDEPLDANRMITFALIWAGLILFTAEGIWKNKTAPA